MQGEGVWGAWGPSFSCLRRSLFIGEEANGSSESSSLLDTAAGLASLRLLAVEGATGSLESSPLSITGELEEWPPRADLRRLETEEATGSSESLDSIGGLTAFRLSVRRGRDSSSESEPSVFSVCFFDDCEDRCGFCEREFFTTLWSLSFGGLLITTLMLSGGGACFLFWGAETMGLSKDSLSD